MQMFCSGDRLAAASNMGCEIDPSEWEGREDELDDFLDSMGVPDDTQEDN